MKTIIAIVALLVGTPAFATLSVTVRNESVCGFGLSGGISPPSNTEAPFVGNESSFPCFTEVPAGFSGSDTASQFSESLSGDGTDLVTFEARFGVEADRAHSQLVTTSTTTHQTGALTYVLSVDVDVPLHEPWKLDITHSLLGAVGGLDGFGSGNAAIGDLLLDGVGPNGAFSSTLGTTAAVDLNPIQFGTAIPVAAEVSDADALAITGIGDAEIDITVSVDCAVETTQRTPVGGDYAICLFGLNDFGPRPDPYGTFGRTLQDDGYQLALELTLVAECNDGLDNDGDQLIDLDDPQCGGDPARRREAGVARRCGLGFEAALALLPLAAARARRQLGRSRATVA